MPIRILPPEVASQIAAGEVVERPASVVKELVENALDAGARSIHIIIEGAGQRLIEISDDGSGIPPLELPLSIERHATSKLHNANDLFRITTLGFRGEALASIGSVARLTITSRIAEGNTGARLRVEGGKALAVQPVGAPVGTVIRVENLFFNVPARLKFLKHETTERRQIDSLVARYALAYPKVRFQVQQEGRPSIQTSGKGDRREALASLFGVEIARQMLEVISKDEGLCVNGFISPTSLTRSHRRDMFFFVNGRPVLDATLTTALLKAYRTLLMVGRFPLSTLFLEVPPETIDVNVHPTKAEVRFREPDRIFSGVQNAARRALMSYSPIPGVQNPPRWSPRPEWGVPSRTIEPAWEMAAGENLRQPTSDASPSSEDSTSLTPAQAVFASQRVPLLRLVGQIANAYLVAEGPDGLYLVDQHAAHERVLFERFMAQHGSEVPSQALLHPETLELSPANARLLADQLPILEHIGFRVEPFGPTTFLVRAIPALLAGSQPEGALRAVVDDFEEDETPLRAEVEARIIARVCKRAAVKAGKTLSPEEQRALLLDLEACQSPRTCPHGRPTMIHLSVDLLERQFGRRGAR